MHTFTNSILGLDAGEQTGSEKNRLLESVVRMILNMRQEAKTRKDFAMADHIRSELNALGIKVKDTKDGFEWESE